MAELLYRIGRFSARRAWAVLITWMVVLGLSVTAYLTLGGTLSSQVTIPGTATAKVTDQLAERFPSASGGSGTIVFHTADGSVFTTEQQTAIGALLKSTGERDGVAAATDPFTTQQQLTEQAQQVQGGQQQLTAGREKLDQAETAIAALPEAQREAQKQQLDAQRAELDAQAAELDVAQKLLDMSSKIRMVSEDGTTAVASVVFDEAQMDVTPETKDAVIDHVTDGVPAGVEAEFSNEITQSVPQVLGVGEVAGLVVAAITLLVMLGALIAAALPIVTALVGVGVGVTASLALSGAVDMLSITPVLGVMLGLAVGIDYCLFILNRHRRQLLDGVELHESIALANGTSGNAVVFAGSTVLVALLALNVTGIGFLGMMGTVGAICVAVAVIIAVTLTPALLALLGTRILPRRLKATIGQSHAGRVPTAPMSTTRALLTAVAGLAVLIVLAIPALSMRLGLPDGSSEAEDSTQYQAYMLIEEKFGAGVNGPLLVVAELPSAVTEPTAEQARIGGAIMAVDNVTAVAPIGQSSDKKLIAFQVIPAEGPNSESTAQLVRDLRELSVPGAALGVAGSASGNIDISEQLSDVLPLYLGVVIGLSLIILILVFRSILVPLTATLGFVLSLFATFGGITAIFQWGWLGAVFGVHDPGPVLSFLPTILIGILFGLAMDYQLFLVSGMREAYAHGAPARLAVRQGLHAGRTVVTAAAIIMISVFGGFIFSHTTMIRSLGFGLAFGVLADAFLVRMLLIPAVMHLLGRSAWWLPRWLDRILPNVDVEGAALERSHPVTHAPVEKEPVSTS
ncbi:putative integral membrane protein [Actinoplanes missouriensis 431]|uniref:Putative integral membrane protein n=1 Tax=Actinoplanes missouriensis (strain ATCC 14538 / DSM 43046 / CBS 188.64 / JCM 3121 / NBRC 102363 / NCIMB 12654 / NRRL B-3342 / UNCC 431) TaxID=512565 RepID=I0H6R7_ACTM4|nr:MMPL family transporter [Actinoplanes missouriensis]BAL88704.1 putative integral membrane protein [Actinoplanes missouriensis 431]